MTKNLKMLIEGLEILDVRGDLSVPVTGITYDSRNAGKGDLFVALKGTRQDGGLFVLDAASRGAGAAVGEDTLENGAIPTFVRVRDSRKALAVLAGNFFDHPSRDLRLVGVTGTSGKTTTTLLLESILAAGNESVGVLGTLAYRWAGKTVPAPMTTPHSLDLQKMFAEMRKDRVSTVVMEVSSHALALGRVAGCSFQAGVFTNLSQDHLDFHGDMESYFQAKAILFRDYLQEIGTRSAAVVNADDPYGERLLAELGERAWSYSVSGRSARVRVKKADLTPAGIRAEFSTPAGDLAIHSKLVGRLNLYNLLTAATTALAMGLPREPIIHGLEAVTSVDGRLQRVPIPKGFDFDVVVDYAHKPDAMEKGLKCLREMTRNRLVVVFGCGGDRDRGKRPIMGEIAARLGDLVVLTSDNPRNEVPETIVDQIEVGVRNCSFPLLGPDGPRGDEKGYAVEPDRRKAIRLALSWARPGDVVFIGGKGHETYQILGNEVIHFDDREVAMDYFTGGPSQDPSAAGGPGK